MDEKLLQEFGEFLRLRERIHSLIAVRLGDTTFGKGYEGILQLTLPSVLEERTKDKTYVIALDSQVLDLGRNVWSGGTLTEVVNKVRKDIDLWHEENSAQQSDSPDNRRP